MHTRAKNHRKCSDDEHTQQEYQIFVLIKNNISDDNLQDT